MFNSSPFGYVVLIAVLFLLSFRGASGFDDKLNSQSSINPQALLSKSKVGFVENKGQIADQNNTPNPAVRFLLNYNGLNVQLRANGFSYDSYVDEQVNTQLPMGNRIAPRSPLLASHSTPTAPNVRRKFHRVDVELVGANRNPGIEPLNPQAATRNYYTPNGEIAGVRSFEKVVYSDIYPHIDLEFFMTNKGEPEYQFIVHPGGNPDDIRLRYNGANNTRIVDGAVELSVAHGKVTDHIPLSYLAGSKKEVKVLFAQTGINEFRCNVPAYSSNETLVIDPTPTLSWGTYFGGSSAETGNGIACDPNGNVYITGYSWSDEIATSGAFQTTNAGNQDAYLVKFSSTGERLWGTFYGGTDTEEGLDVACDASGNVYVTGFSWSNNAISTAGAHQSAFGGIQDAFIVKFSGAGIRQWATYYGGSEFDIGYGIACDANGNVLVTGQTSSDNAISTARAHQELFGGTHDAFVVKFSATGVRQWGTYYGGTDDDRGYDISFDASGNVLVAGFTNSQDAIASAGAHQTTSPNGYEAFVVKFSAAGARQWGTYYGGTDFDQGFGVACDASGNVYVTGTTRSPNDIATAGTYQPAIGGNQDAFIVKFSGAGVRQWGTYYGGNDLDGGSDIILDAGGNLYISGYAASTSGIATLDAYQVSRGGSFDALLAKFSNSGALIWGTYYGGNDDDFGLGVARDANGNLYVTGLTLSSNAIATTGAYDETLTGEDAFIASFNEPNFTTSGVVWLQGTSITGIADGQTVQTWIDDSGADDNAVQNTAGTRPTYRNNATDNINGNPVIAFSGTKALGMAASSVLGGGSEKVIFAVFRTGANTLARQTLVDIGGIASGFNMYISNGRLYAGAWDNASWWLNRDVNPNRTYLAQFVYDGTQLRLSLSTTYLGTTVTSSSFSDPTITDSKLLGAIGATQQQSKYHNGVNTSTTYSDFFTGKIAEVIILNSSHVDGRTQIFDYLNSKYAIGATEQPLAKGAIFSENDGEIETRQPMIVSTPNPIIDAGALTFTLANDGNYQLVLQDMLGNTVRTIGNGSHKAGTYTVEYTTDYLASGMYRAVLTSQTGSISVPVMIVK